MTEDFAYGGIPEGQLQIQKVFQNLNTFLQRHAKTISDYDLLELLPEINIIELPQTILEELSYSITPEELAKSNTLNRTQRIIFDNVIDLISRNEREVLFVDGPAGSRKTYLYDCLIAHVRAYQKIVLAIASSGIAALLLRGGHMVHSRFKIPISMIDGNATCNVKKGSDLA
ncbi:3935_t:CDS:1 [Acaulospora morrowiae]|uniref:ATP-dependent DNA helicase n=1 Tax=Acaulospora morrowiae TaxID=94023 RepID=A0A9N9N8U9_9GLOM|nr:3935_t:CDS:1 [Acaulospora morrowiae]